MNKKVVILDEHAHKEMSKFSNEVQDSFGAMFDLLQEKGTLDFPDARKISKKIFEIRVKVEGEYRGLYAYLSGDHIIVLHLFRKKSQKTPLKDLELAERRLMVYENS